MFFCHGQKRESLAARGATKNRYITLNISEYPGRILTYFTGLVVVLIGIITFGAT